MGLSDKAQKKKALISQGFNLISDGGPKEDRTPDLRIANAALSQLSYRPTIVRL